MCTGKKPFVEDEKKSAMHKIRLEKHTSARKVNPDIPRELSNIIDRCLEKQPRDRWRSAQQMTMALERFLGKHVEMNHHARLVLFLRSQGVITELEAEEYLNPAALGAAGAHQPNLQARNVVRGGVVAHAVTLGMLLLMLGLIHVAPLGATPRSVLSKDQGRGYLKVDAHPWARVFVDGKELGLTPIGKPLEVIEGQHVIKLVHDWYEPYERKIEVVTAPVSAATSINIDFDAMKIPLKAGKTKPAASFDPSAPAGAEP
jgi:hypothetical protein